MSQSTREDSSVRQKIGVRLYAETKEIKGRQSKALLDIARKSGTCILQE